MRYDSVYRTLAKRAVSVGSIDAEAFIEQAVSLGMSPERVRESLLIDLDTGGPIFGRFFRSLGSAAESAVATAASQGNTAAALATDAEVAQFLSVADLEDVIDAADPEVLEAIEDAGLDQEATWIARMIDTCAFCLPLHGRTMTRGEWAERGLAPIKIHQDKGIDNHCYCELRATHQIDESLTLPLVRQRLPKDKGKVSKRTVRDVTQKAVDKALAARDKALQSETGRRTLRLLGKVGDEQEE